MKSNLICMLITIVAYLILMIVVGILASKKNKDTSDFYLGGRKLGPIVTAMSAEASDMSSYLLMGLPGLALLTGFADVGWTVIGLAIGTYLNWLFVAKRLRIYSQHNGSITIPDFFSNHSEIAQSPSQGRTDGQNVVRLCGIGCNIIGVVERKIARQSLCIFHNNINTASLDNSKDNHHDQCNGHNNALEQVGCAGSQESADAGIGNDDYST